MSEDLSYKLTKSLLKTCCKQSKPMAGILLSSASDSGGKWFTTSNAVCSTSVQMEYANDGCVQLWRMRVNRSRKPVRTPVLRWKTQNYLLNGNSCWFI